MLKSTSAKHQLLDIITSKLSKDQLASLTPTLLPIAEDFPPFRRKCIDIGLISDKSEETFEEQLRKVKILADAGHCSLAKKEFSTLLSTKRNEEFLDQAVEAAKFLSQCKRPKTMDERIAFWQGEKVLFEKAFGFIGKSAIGMRIAIAYWGRDKFDEAKEILVQELAAAKKAKNVEAESQALFMLAQIAENQSDWQTSHEYYEEYAQNHAEEEQIMRVLIALTLLHAENGKVDEAETYAAKILDIQKPISIDDRDVDSYTFALFWVGRFLERKGKSSEALSMWEELAKDYYSTFYGVLGHRMLEKSSGKLIPLYPNPAPEIVFNSERLAPSFDERQQRIVERIKSLLSLGLREEAFSEILELDIDDTRYDQVLAYSMLLNAANRWVKSISTFQQLPRSYRLNLPSGMELLLYPKAFEEDIFQFAQRAKLDPVFALALIRQESLFNPEARSGAGAFGLMQLTPATAKLEAKKIDSEYLSEQTKKHILGALAKPQNLYDPDINLALGMKHLQRIIGNYENIVQVLAAYNAGQGIFARWKSRIQVSDPLSFIESIPYKETRMYIKLVLRNYFYYSRWYGDGRPMLTYLEPLIDFNGHYNQNSNRTNAVVLGPVQEPKETSTAH